MMKKSFRLVIACLQLAMGSSAAFAETLDQLAGKTHYHGIAFARSGSAVLLLASHHGLFALDKNGEATRVSPVHDYMGFSPDPTDPLSFYASGHPVGGGNSGFLKSNDGGATWKQLSSGLRGPVDFHQMDVSPINPQTIFGNYGGMQVSHDSGQTWADAGFSPLKLVAIAASGINADLIYAATQNGLYSSADAGKTWQPLDFDGKVVSAIETGPNGSLYAFVLGQGLMKAQEDKPKEWTVLSNEFGNAFPLHIAIDPADDKHLALTTQNNDVLESHDGGAIWAPFGKVK
jgi:photosystem II stability/assembly factor-like uncharacterized protein